MGAAFTDDLARAAYAAYADNYGTRLPFDKLSKREQLAWGAAVIGLAKRIATIRGSMVEQLEAQSRTAPANEEPAISLSAVPPPEPPPLPEPQAPVQPEPQVIATVQPEPQA